MENAGVSRDTERAMSEENVALVRAAWEPLTGANLAEIDWSAGFIRDTLGRTYSPDVELTTLASGFGIGIDEHYSGMDGLVSYLREWLEPFSEYQVENLDYIGAGNFVLIPSRQWGVGRESGIRTELELTTLCELRDGRIVRIHQYDTLEDARAAAGVSE
jgi:ketosteroid isomerase-like protein